MGNKLLISRYIIGLVLVVFYQIIIAPRVSLFGYQADLAIIFTVWIGLIHGPKSGAYFGFLAGFAVSVLTPSELGWTGLLLLLVGYIVGTVGNKLEIDPIPIKGLILLISAFAFNVFQLLFTKFELVLLNPVFVLYSTLFPAILSALAGVIIFYIIRYRFVIKDLF